VATHSVASVGTKEYDELLRLLRETREALPISQELLSKKLGKARTYIEKIETGKRRVDVIELFAIATAMNQQPISFLQELHNRIEAFEPKKK
jgi:transcriptional regulator with XRE-family HTH domain